MPELPEVETITRDLNNALRRKKIIRVEAFDKTYKVFLPAIKKAAAGKKIRRIYRRAKNVVIDCGDRFLIIHLKMTGQLMYRSKKNIIAGGHPIVSTGVSVPNKYTRLIFYFNEGALYFNDLRKFGWVRAASADELSAAFEKIGPEPLNKKDFSFEIFRERLGRRRKALIKAALLDQSVIAGLGNIYVDEVLFKSQIKPSRRVCTLTARELRAIWTAIPQILNKSINQRGTTFSNFLDPNGLRGNFVPYLKVYGRKGKACSRCGGPILKTRLAGRGTHWCRYCQK